MLDDAATSCIVMSSCEMQIKGDATRPADAAQRATIAAIHRLSV